MSTSIDIDIGGTFTDCFAVLDGRQVWCKTRTSTYDLSVGMNEAIAAANSFFSKNALPRLHQASAKSGLRAIEWR